MDEYQHMERFSMENDFEDGKWIDGDFYARKRKQGKRQTKEEALYGYEDESDSDIDDSGKKRRRDVSKKSDLTKPVSFVSTGTVMPAEEIDKQEKEEQANGVGAGLGFGGAGLGSGLGLGAASGLGFGAKGIPNVEEEIEEELLPTAFGRRIKEAAERREMEREKEKKSVTKAKSLASGGPGSGPVFEMHTKGIGMKLLEKMGYKGGGLGKNQQGIAKPIEAKLRPRNMGMGFNDFSETTAGLPAPPGTQQADENVVEAKPKSKEKLWMKKNKGKKKPELRTAAELLAEKEAHGGGTVQTVLDMRGPQPRVLTNLENLNAEQIAIEDNTPMPELQHNLRLIVDMAEAEIQTYDQKLRHERDTVLILNKERERLQTAVNAQADQIDIMESVMAMLEQIQRQVAEGGTTLESLASAFKSLKYTYREEYKLFSLGIIALSYALPLMSNLFRGWQPFLQPLHGIEAIAAWQELLQGSEPQDFAIFQDVDNSSPYTQLVMETVLPAIRSATVNLWQPRDPEPILRFLEVWEKLLPGGVLQNILDGLVMPKLIAAVDTWDPRLDEVPIHAWLHPWLPLLGTRMEPLYIPIRYKLGVALQAWHPGDSSALALLQPWQAVFDPASWEQLIVRSILPKLIYVMQDFVINPAQQSLDQFNWVKQWASAIPLHHMVNLLEVTFFPKWQQVLCHWLSASPNYDEVTQWFLGWKSLLPLELQSSERVRHQLNLALDMMNQSLEGTPIVQAGARENLSYLRAAEQRLFEIAQQPDGTAYAQLQKQHAITQDENGSAAEMSLKEVVEAFAQENDVQFLPKLGRSHEGLQVYSFGAVNVVVDTAKQRVLAQTGDRWALASLEQILEMHRSRGGSRWK